MDSTAQAQASPGLFIGPLVLGPFFQAILQGVLIDMTWRYYTRAKNEHKAILCLVAFVTVAALVQTAAGLYDLWANFVTGFGDWVGVTGFKWPEKVQTVYQATMSAPVQGYYIYRCWKVTNKSYWVLIPLSVILLSNWAVACNTTVRVFEVFSKPFPVLPPSAPGAPPIVFKIPIDIIFIYWLVSGAVLDMLITGILLNYLLRSQSKAEFGGLNTVIRKLVYILWQTAIPPCACALAVVIIYIVMIEDATQNVDLFFQQILGKLYCVSLLVTLNSRLEIQSSRNATTYEMGPWSARDFKSSVRVDIRTTRDDGRTTQLDTQMGGPETQGMEERKVRYQENHPSYLPSLDSDEKVNTSIV